MLCGHTTEITKGLFPANAPKSLVTKNRTNQQQPSHNKEPSLSINTVYAFKNGKYAWNFSYHDYEYQAIYDGTVCLAAVKSTGTGLKGSIEMIKSKEVRALKDLIILYFVGKKGEI